MKCYIAGPMRGIKDFNFAAFFEVEDALVSRGHNVCNPARHDVNEYGADFFKSPTGDLADIPGFSLADAMSYDLDMIVNKVEAIVMLPGWSKSSGAKHEKATAELCGKQVLYWHPDNGIKIFPSAVDEPVSTLEVRLTSESGGQKGRKPERLSLLPTKGLWAIGRVFGFGANKYDDHNWRKGYPWSWSLDAAMRHLTAFIDGEDNDPESGESHIAHLGFHVLVLLEWLETARGNDDRWCADDSR